MIKAFLWSALILVPTAAYAVQPPIRSRPGAACHQEASKRVASDPSLRGLSRVKRYSINKQIWLECMKRPR